MLGCIPRSPSPEVQNPEDEATGPGNALQEVRNLRVSPTSEFRNRTGGLTILSFYTGSACLLGT